MMDGELVYTHLRHLGIRKYLGTGPNIT